MAAPAATGASGGDPVEAAAVNCALGYHEKREYPYGVIVAVLLATAGTLLLLRRARDYDMAGSDA